MFLKKRTNNMSDKTINITTPISRETARSLKAGDSVSISGVIYTARDAAHKRMLENLEKGIPLPVELKDQTIYFAGPSPAKPGEPIGSVGPTTSYRMDAYSPKTIELGLTCMIGKGARNNDVIEAMKMYGAVYIGAVGGAGALISGCVKKAEVVAYPDLGSEAIHRLEVENFPGIVIIDSEGTNLYETEPPKYIQA
ncbi:MAG: Fe-S-containing hydro-lyase [Firmicutes bacterium]|nr:Fe-S-containing hydro-lyase [Bacillota bacterium]